MNEEKSVGKIPIYRMETEFKGIDSDPVQVEEKPKPKGNPKPKQKVVSEQDIDKMVEEKLQKALKAREPVVEKLESKSKPIKEPKTTVLKVKQIKPKRKRVVLQEPEDEEPKVEPKKVATQEKVSEEPQQPSEDWGAMTYATMGFAGGLLFAASLAKGK